MPDALRLTPVDDPVPLDDLARSIRASSNFRFDWQFYRFDGMDAASAADARRALEIVIANPALHRFLRESHDLLYDHAFSIEPLHEHCRVEPAGDAEFAGLLARAAGDHLGAYSKELRGATAAETREVRELFERVGGPYSAYHLLPGEVAGCATCRDYNSHLFTTWFYGVAWDYCLLAAWPRAQLLWLGCLTDTD